MVCAEFARFLGLQFTSRATISDIVEAVCGVAVDTRGSVVLCDEIRSPYTTWLACTRQPLRTLGRWTA